MYSLPSNVLYVADSRTNLRIDEECASFSDEDITILVVRLKVKRQT